MLWVSIFFLISLKLIVLVTSVFPEAVARAEERRAIWRILHPVSCTQRVGLTLLSCIFKFLHGFPRAVLLFFHCSCLYQQRKETFPVRHLKVSRGTILGDVSGVSKWLIPLPLLLTWTLPALPRPAPSWLTWDPPLYPKQLVLCYRPFLSSHSPGDIVCPLGCCWLLSLQPAHEGTEPSEQWANQPGKGTSWKSKRSFLQTLAMIPANHSAEGKYSCIWRALVQRGQERKHRTNFTIECYLYVPQFGE